MYLDVTSSNYGKITWDTVKPIIQGKILFAPNTADINTIMSLVRIFERQDPILFESFIDFHFFLPLQSNSTFEEINRLKMLSVAFEEILTKLKQPGPFQEAFDALINLAKTPFVRSIIGDEIDLDQVEGVINRIRTDPVIYDVVRTIKNLLECISVDRFLAFDTEDELRHQAYELNQKRVFFAAIYFNETQGENIAYKLHMDTQNSQPTIENRNRFWFPGPSGSMLLDLKYHRGFVQIKQSLDMGIIKYKKEQLQELGILQPPSTPKPPGPLFTVDIDTGDDEEDDEDEDDDEWFTSLNTTNAKLPTAPPNKTMVSSIVSGIGLDVKNNVTSNQIQTVEEDIATDSPTEDLALDTTTEAMDKEIDYTTMLPNLSDELDGSLDSGDILKRQKRQGFGDLFSSFGGASQDFSKFDIDNLKYYTKQFPYPAYTQDE